MTLCFPFISGSLTNNELMEKMQDLNYMCHSSLGPKIDRMRWEREFHLLTEIMYKGTGFQFISVYPFNIVGAAVRIMMRYADTTFYSKVDRVSSRKRKRRSQLTRDICTKLFILFMAERPREIAQIVINIINDEQFWQSRRSCLELISLLIDCGYKGSIVCEEICEKIDKPDKSKKIDIKLIVTILYEILDIYKWPDTDETLAFLETLLNIYFKSLNDDIPPDSDDAHYPKLRGSLEVCVRHIAQKISNKHLLFIIECMSSWSIKKDVTDNVILNYGSTLEHVAHIHKQSSLSKTVSSEMLTLLMQMIGSKVRFVSLLGNRVFQYLIDRSDKKLLFNTPKIFFEGMRLNLRMKSFHKEDSEFLRQHREEVHDSLIKSIINHQTHRLNLETTYCTICLLAVEVPCGFTATALCCVMVTLQEYVRKHPEEFGKESSYHIHAIIISVITFVCWIHKSKDFYGYVNKIVMERAQWAPHLNPPLRSRYEFAQHHALWDKPELYLVDWEVRFGLWKCFRLDERDSRRTRQVIYSKLEKLDLSVFKWIE